MDTDFLLAFYCSPPMRGCHCYGNTVWMTQYNEGNQEALCALMSPKSWKDSGDPDLFLLGYLSKDSTRHILSGHSLLVNILFTRFVLVTTRKTYLQVKHCKSCPRLWITAVLGPHFNGKKDGLCWTESSSQAKSLENLYKSERRSPKP